TTAVLAPTLTRASTTLNRPPPRPLPKAKQADGEPPIKPPPAPRSPNKAANQARGADPTAAKDLLAGFPPEFPPRRPAKTIPEAERARITADIRALIEKEQASLAGSPADEGSVQPGQQRSFRAVDPSLDEGITEEDLKAQMHEEEMHPDYRRGAEPEFEG